MNGPVDGRAAYKRVAQDESVIADDNSCTRPRLDLRPPADGADVNDEGAALLDGGSGVELVGVDTSSGSGSGSVLGAPKPSSPRLGLPIVRFMDPHSVPIEIRVGSGSTAQDEIDAIFRDQVERLLKSPKQIVTALLELQSTKLNPLDVETSPAIADIAQHVADAKNEVASLQLRGAAQPLANTSYKYDCFISYRVASEANTAETLYLYLERRGLRPFLDKKCLKKGANWKDDFLDSLRQSRTFLPLVSNKALERCRDAHRDHSGDNFLLEIQTALSIKHVKDKHGVYKYILPVLVGAAQHDGSYLDFHFNDLALYVDFIERQMLVSWYRALCDVAKRGSAAFERMPRVLSCITNLFCLVPQFFTCLCNSVSYTATNMPKPLVSLLACVAVSLTMTVGFLIALWSELSRFERVQSHNIKQSNATFPNVTASSHSPHHFGNDTLDSLFQEHPIELGFLVGGGLICYLSCFAGVAALACATFAYSCGLVMRPTPTTT